MAPSFFDTVLLIYLIFSVIENCLLAFALLLWWLQGQAQRREQRLQDEVDQIALAAWTRS